MFEVLALILYIILTAILASTQHENGLFVWLGMGVMWILIAKAGREAEAVTHRAADAPQTGATKCPHCGRVNWPPSSGR